MYEIGYLGKWETVPPLIAAIYDRNFEVLKQLIENGEDLNKEVRLCQWITIYPIETAVYMNDKEMIETLLNDGANPKLPHTPLFETAIRYCDPQIAKMFAYQAETLHRQQKFRLYECIGWANRPENIAVLEDAEITVKEFGGMALRTAVLEKNFDYVTLLLKKGVDVNFCKKDSVFAQGETAVSIAASRGYFEVVKQLVEYGADVTICDQYGNRPYNEAVQAGFKEIAEYVKNLEPKEWHEESQRDAMLAHYKMPGNMVKYIKTQPLRIDFPQYEHVKWVEFYPYMELREMKWKGREMLSLVSKMHNYYCLVVWNPRTRKLCGLDVEHGKLIPMCGWTSFIEDPGKWLNKMVFWET